MISNMEEQGMIEPSISPLTTPIFLTLKKIGRTDCASTIDAQSEITNKTDNQRATITKPQCKHQRENPNIQHG